MGDVDILGGLAGSSQGALPIQHRIVEDGTACQGASTERQVSEGASGQVLPDMTAFVDQRSQA